MPLSETAQKFYEKEYGQLRGFTVTGLAMDDSDDSFCDEPTFGLILEKGKRKFIAWISQDEEGNGPGFLHIEEQKQEVSSLSS